MAAREKAEIRPMSGALKHCTAVTFVAVSQPLLREFARARQVLSACTA